MRIIPSFHIYHTHSLVLTLDSCFLAFASAPTPGGSDEEGEGEEEKEEDETFHDATDNLIAPRAEESAENSHNDREEEKEEPIGRRTQGEEAQEMGKLVANPGMGSSNSAKFDLHKSTLQFSVGFDAQMESIRFISQKIFRANKLIILKTHNQQCFQIRLLSPDVPQSHQNLTRTG